MSPDILGIIPARGGSKGIPHKNTRMVGGKPLITWTCEAARAAPSLDRLLVSTDDPHIAQLARETGVEVPFLRAAEFSTDTALAIEVIGHVLDRLQRKDEYRPDFVLWLQPTSPLRTTADIEASIALLREKSADSVVSVYLAEHHHPQLMKRIENDGRLFAWLTDRKLLQRRQEMQPVFALNGAIYLTRRDVLVAQNSFYPEVTYAYIMPPERSIDVDTPWDLYLVDLILKDLNNNGLD